MKVLNGKIIADKLKSQLKSIIIDLKKQNEVDVCLAVIQVGDDPASTAYVNRKEKLCKELGVYSKAYHLDESITTEEVIELIMNLNKDETVNGIMVQMPLPKHLDSYKIVNSISVMKDVDCLTDASLGSLVAGNAFFIPCTARSIMWLLDEYNINVDGLNCVVVGRSNIVGKPTAIELMHRNATVTICHSHTRGLKQICREADVIVCAVGKPKFFDKEYISLNTVVIDAGIHRLEDGSICGDVNFEDVKDNVLAITPCPNGVGSLTSVMLMKNCLEAAVMQYETKEYYSM